MADQPKPEAPHSPAATRNRVLLSGAAIALVLVAVVVYSLWIRKSSLFVGPLSSAHSTVANNCSACHTATQEVTNEKCSVCHERLASHLGFYTFAAHYVYVSGNQTRAFTREHEIPCAGCHSEHRGREARVTAVPAERCVGCHPYAPFETRHPQFAFAANNIADDSALSFTHIKHVERVLTREKETDIEVACLTCHQVRAGGKSFEPLNFARNCSACHLGPDIMSASLKVAPPGGLTRRSGERLEVQLGVETLDAIRKAQAPGDQWALSMSSSQFDESAGQVTKQGIMHEDPWITHNLRSLRRLLYPSRGLADLLVASPDVDEFDKKALYEEALGTLRKYAAGLQTRPERSIQDDLTEIDRVAADLERRISDPSTPLSAVKFRIDRTRNPALTDDQVKAVEAFAEKVAEPCLQCHVIQDATIKRPHADQRILRRAVFNHRAHVIQRGCLECHTEIPFLKYLDTATRIDPAVDSAPIQNIPKIERCRECHTGGQASTNCSKCHEFHPNKDARSGLRPFVQ